VHRFLALALCAVFVAVHTSEGAAQRPSLPPVIEAGFSAYKTDGSLAAFKAWLKGGPLENSEGVLEQARGLSKINDAYGPYQSFDVVQLHQVSPRLLIAYVVMNCRHGAVFAKFILYKDGETWVVLKLDINTSIEHILPAQLLVH